MCRLLAFLSDEPLLLADILLRPRMSLVRQSYAAQERRQLPQGVLPSMAYQQPCLNADGFGVGWYNASYGDAVSKSPEIASGLDCSPCVFTSLKPAWNDPNLRNIAEEVRSPLLLAHVRAAGPLLPVSDSTCHPFKAGRLLFAHNGMVGEFPQVQRTLMNCLNEFGFSVAVAHGCIDSAIGFGIFLTELGIEEEAHAFREHTADEICGALCRTLDRMSEAAAAAGTEESLLNFVICDGERIVACRYATAPSAGGFADDTTEPQPLGATLYLSTGSRWIASSTDPSTYRMRKGADIKCSTAILSSEPLTSIRQEWLPIAPNSIVVCGLGRGQSAAIDTLMFTIKAECPRCPLSALLGVESSSSVAPAEPNLQSAPACLDQHSRFSESMMTLTGNSQDTNCVASLFGGTIIAAGSMDGSLRFFDSESGQICSVRRHSEASGPVLALLVLEGGATGTSTVSSSANSPDASPTLSPTLPRKEPAFLESLSATGENSSLRSANSAPSLSTLGASCPKLAARRARECSIDSTESSLCDAAGRQRQDSNELIGRQRLDSNECDARSGMLGRQTSPTQAAIDSRSGRLVRQSSPTASREIPSILLLSTASNELRIWDITALSSPRSKGKEEDVPCLFCIRFAPNQGQLLAVAGTLDSILLGFQSTRIFRLRLGSGWNTFQSKKGRCDAVRHITCNIDAQHCWKQKVSQDTQAPESPRSPGKIDSHNCLTAMHALGCGHLGFVQCLAHDASRGIVASGGGDGQLFFWDMSKRRPLASFAHGGAVMALALDDVSGELFSGDARGRIRIWDLEAVERGSRAVLVGSSTAAVLALDLARGPLVRLVAGDAAGLLRIWDTREMLVLREVSTSMTCCATLCVLQTHAQLVRIACGGCSSGAVKLVDLEVPNKELETCPAGLVPELDSKLSRDCSESAEFQQLLVLLQEFVAIPTITDDPAHQADTQRGTMWLAQRYEELLGCTVRVSGNCVVARCGWDETKPLVVFYSHFDVVDGGSGWRTDPWDLTAVDGYLYGRGVSNNKGPLLAQIFGVRRLLHDNTNPRASQRDDEFVMHVEPETPSFPGGGSSLAFDFQPTERSESEPRRDPCPVNVLFVTNGTPEVGSVATVLRVLREARADGWLRSAGRNGAAGLIVTNSAWIDDQSPCICYGMRGILDLEVRVVGSERDLHSGVHGGLVPEPLIDLMALGASLADPMGVPSVPGLLEGVRAPCEEDCRNLEVAAERLHRHGLRSSLGLTEGSPGPSWLENDKVPGLEALRRTWLFPSLSLTEVRTDRRHHHGRRIAHEASFIVSVRTTPCQRKADVEAAMRQHLQHEFAKRRTHNRLVVTTLAACDWWEARTTSALYRAARGGLADAWHMDEASILAVREGGTMAVLSALEAELGCDAVHMALSEASDAALLPNERMSRKGLAQSVGAIAATLRRLAAELSDDQKNGAMSA